MKAVLDLSRFTRVRLAHLPTPLEFMAGLSLHIGGPRLFVKRDDCTGLAFGGNKARKLEFALAEAVKADADSLITSGGWQSNHVRQTAAAAARLRWRYHAVVAPPFAEPTASYSSSGNLLLDNVLGARIHRVSDDGPATTQKIEEIVCLERRHGHRPFVLTSGASNGLGALGYANCAKELLSQAEAQGLQPTHIILPTGGGGTQAGLIMGLRLLGSGIEVIGMSVSESSEVKEKKVNSVADQMSDVLGLSRTPLTGGDIAVRDEYAGGGYAVPSPAANAAIRLIAATEGILLDPAYTGKALAGLLDLFASGELADARDVIFLHTGGVPALFAYPEEFAVAAESAEALV